MRARLPLRTARDVQPGSGAAGERRGQVTRAERFARLPMYQKVSGRVRFVTRPRWAPRAPATPDDASARVGNKGDLRLKTGMVPAALVPDLIRWLEETFVGEEEELKQPPNA